MKTNRTTVCCENDKCIYCDQEWYQCTREIIRVGENQPYGCLDYLPYTDMAEYREPYFIIVRADGDLIVKLEKRGKLIRLGDLCFYTSDRIHVGLECYLTEERTGRSAGTLRELVEKPERLEQIKEKLKEFPDVQTFPLAVWEKTGEISGHYVLVEETEETEE